MTDQERIQQIKALCEPAGWDDGPAPGEGNIFYKRDVLHLLDMLSQAEAERERLEAALKDVIDTICRPGSTADEVFNIAHLAWLKAKETK